MGNATPRSFSPPAALLALCLVSSSCAADLPGWLAPGPAEPDATRAAWRAPAQAGAAVVSLADPTPGLVVHEWGTDTVVSGSDGSLQRGLHHEEEDLPPFVYDRIKSGTAPRSISVEFKMETPVLYFYSAEALDVSVQVDFPRGVMTQFYPDVRRFWPGLGQLQGVIGDPVFDPAFPFVSERCATDYPRLIGGGVRWDAHLLPRGTDVQDLLQSAPLERYSWAHARAVAANPLEVVNGSGEVQTERFLFYRGLGNGTPPLVVTAAAGGRLTLRNTADAPIGAAFVIAVGGGRGAFTRSRAIGAGQSTAAPAPSLEGAEGLDAFSDALAAAMTTAIKATGLHADEAVAMVNTWRRQWFRTDGLRVLYIAPDGFVDEQIPLTIQPAPVRVVRMMMLRTEVLTPELEALDTTAAAAAASDPAGAQAWFAALGRFGEPRLRRASDLLGQPGYLEPILAALAGPAAALATQ